jgi:hypothetical protein
MTQIKITDIQTGVTLRDVVGDCLSDLRPSLPLNPQAPLPLSPTDLSPLVIDQFVSDFANLYGNFLLMDIDNNEWDIVAAQTEDCFNWLQDTLVSLGLSCQLSADLAEHILNSSIEFMQPEMSKVWKQLVGV